jgi:hypothetical protein
MGSDGIKFNILLTFLCNLKLQGRDEFGFSRLNLVTCINSRAVVAAGCSDIELRTENASHDS